MDKLVRRVTLIQRNGDKREASTVYQEPEKKVKKGWTRPLERIARRMLKADLIYAQERLRRHDESNRRRSNGWLIEAPKNIIEARRARLKEARKASPFRSLSKA